MGNVLRAFGIVASLAVAYWFSLDSSKQASNEQDQQDEYVVKKKSARTPASTKASRTSKNSQPSFLKGDGSTSLSFSENAQSSAPSEVAKSGGGPGSESSEDLSSLSGGGSSGGDSAGFSNGGSGSSGGSSGSYGGRSSSTTGTSSYGGTKTASNNSTTSGTSGTTGSVGVAAPAYYAPPGSITSGTSSGTTSGSTGGTTDGSTGGTSGGASDSLTCSVGQGSGVFGYPIQVGITCSTASEIKYCVQQGSCCDPRVSGVTYSSPVVIGSQDGSYCLSYYGVSSSTSSSVGYATYTINNTFPHLQVQTPKIQYQTTELPLANILVSNNFGSPGYSLGQINMMSHDPGVTGLNLGCEEIVEEYAAIPAPVPAPTFDPLDLSAVLSGVQVNVSIPLEKLSYGENYLTTYVVNHNYAAPLYSCTTNKVTLKDFEFFRQESSFATARTAYGYTEFTGSVVVYGFFEQEMESNPIRAPAGSTTENVSGQELSLNSFGVFY